MNGRKVGIIGRGSVTPTMLDAAVPITVDATIPNAVETMEIHVGGRKITVNKEKFYKHSLWSAGIGVML